MVCAESVNRFNKVVGGSPARAGLESAYRISFGVWIKSRSASLKEEKELEGLGQSDESHHNSQYATSILERDPSGRLQVLEKFGNLPMVAR